MNLQVDEMMFIKNLKVANHIMNDLITKWKKQYKEFNQQYLFMITPFQIILVLVTLALVTFALITGFSSSKASLSIKALKNYLKDVQNRLWNNSPMDAGKERADMEILFNKVKSNCGEELISGNLDLKSLVKEASEKISFISDNNATDKKTSWLQFKASILGFQDIYFKGQV
jgi:hypothetical protein